MHVSQTWEAVSPQEGAAGKWGCLRHTDPFLKWALEKLEENMQSLKCWAVSILDTQDYGGIKAIAREAASSAEGQ